MPKEKHFNTAGPSIADDHYMVDPLVRIDLEEVEALIGQKRYYVLHAPRQTGKTTSLLALMEHLNRQGRYRALYGNIERAQAARGGCAGGYGNNRPNPGQRGKLLAIDNLVDLIFTCVYHPAAVNQVFLAAEGKELSIPELLRRLSITLGRPAAIDSGTGFIVENRSDVIG